MTKKINLDDSLVERLGQYGNRDETWNTVTERVLNYVDEEAALADRDSRDTVFETTASESSSPLDSLEDDTIVRHEYHRGEYGGEVAEGRVVGGEIEYNGTTYSSVSGAAEAADENIRGDDATTHNGWLWWTYQDSSGDWVELDALR